MKHICSLNIEGVILKHDNLRHQFYLLAYRQYEQDVSEKVLSAQNLSFKFFTCNDDCSGSFGQTKVEIFED